MSAPHDFVEDRTHDGRRFRMLNVVDEFTHECLAIRVARKLKAVDVIDVLSDLFILRGIPGHIRSRNGPEFVAQAVQDWIKAVGAKTAYIAPGSPWENGYGRELQRPPPGRAPRWGDLPQPAGSRDRDRKLAAPPQHRPAPRLVGPQAARARGPHPVPRRPAGRARPACFAGQPRHGATARAAPTFTPDHSVGAGHLS